MNTVIATRILRRPSYSGRQVAHGSSYAGYLLMTPEVGKPLLIFLDNAGWHLRTSPVKRVLTSCVPRTVYVETQNNTYCVHGTEVELHEA